MGLKSRKKRSNHLFASPIPFFQNFNGQRPISFVFSHSLYTITIKLEGSNHSQSRMAFSKSISLVALLSLAFLACSFVASPANAVSVDAHHYVRRDHAAIAKKRSTSISATKRCKPRPASSTSTTTTVSTPKPSVKSVSLPPKTTSAPAPSSAPAQPQPSSTSGSGKRCLGWANGDDPALAKWAHGKADLYVYVIPFVLTS